MLVSDVQNYLGPNLWQKYAKIFDSIWMGSAFKGANKPDSVIVNETQYLANHFAWIGLAKEQSSAIKFKGMILTGWQRYDHFVRKITYYIISLILVVFDIEIYVYQVPLLRLFYLSFDLVIIATLILRLYYFFSLFHVKSFPLLYLHWLHV